MGNTIKINNGLKIYDIEDQNGNIIGQFNINPTDAGMVKRYSESLKSFEDIKKEYINKEAGVETFVELQERVVNELCNIVGNDSVKVFFEVMGAFSLQDGKLYFEQVYEIIGNIIQEEGKKQKAKMRKRIEDYGKKFK